MTDVFTPSRGEGFVPNRLNLVTDLKDAFAGIGLVPAVRPYPEGAVFPEIDPDRFVEVQFRTLGEARRASRAFAHSSKPGMGEAWPSVTVWRRVTVAVPVTEVEELIRCLKVERATPVEASVWGRFLEWVTS